MTEIIHKEDSFEIIGACFEVYKELGPGFLEEVYHQALKVEFQLRKIAFRSKSPLPLKYKGHLLETSYEPDFICNEKVILEIKAVTSIGDFYRAKVKHDLKSSGMRLGLLVNFCHAPKLEYERVVL